MRLLSEAIKVLTGQKGVIYGQTCHLGGRSIAFGRFNPPSEI